MEARRGRRCPVQAARALGGSSAGMVPVHGWERPMATTKQRKASTKPIKSKKSANPTAATAAPVAPAVRSKKAAPSPMRGQIRNGKATGSAPDSSTALRVGSKGAAIVALLERVNGA